MYLLLAFKKRPTVKRIRLIACRCDSFSNNLPIFRRFHMGQDWPALQEWRQPLERGCSLHKAVAAAV